MKAAYTTICVIVVGIIAYLLARGAKAPAPIATVVAAPPPPPAVAPAGPAPVVTVVDPAPPVASPAPTPAPTPPPPPTVTYLVPTLVFDTATNRWYIKGIPAPYDNMPILAVGGETASANNINRSYDVYRYYYYKPGDTQIIGTLSSGGDTAFMTTGPGASAPVKQWILNPTFSLIGGSF